jgi:hypothetical protein
MPSISGNRTGKGLEDAVAALLDDAGYERVQPASLFFAMRDLGQPIYCRQPTVGTSLYGTPRRVDILLYHPRKWPHSLVIQCKWQARTGTVHEKFPYEVLSIAQSGYETIIVLDGGGFSKASQQWLKGQAGRNLLKHVFALGEFQRYISRGEL